MKRKFDSLDRRILQKLSEDPSLTYKQLASSLGCISENIIAFRDKIFYRVSMMRKHGIIKRSYLEFNPDFFGFKIKKNLYVTLCDKKDMEFFEDTMRIRKEAREMRMIRGDYDYSITCIFRSEDEYIKFKQYLIDLDVLKNLQEYDIGNSVFEKSEFPFIL